MDKMTGESWVTTTFETLEDWAASNSFCWVPLMLMTEWNTRC